MKHVKHVLKQWIWLWSPWLILWTGQAWGQPVETSTKIMPTVMILLDSSGSMSWTPGGGYKNPRCSSRCDRDTTSGNSEKSRLIVAKEVMTGSFASNEYFCCQVSRPSPFDGYGIPHWEVPSSVTQHDDGVLDTYRDIVKFGIAGFDSSTATSTRASGCWSYANNWTYHGRTMNLGIQNEREEALAPLIPATPTDDRNTILNQNSYLQNRIRWLYNWGGTPISAALSDYNYMFQHHDDFRIGGNDPYAACRPKAVILITDGEPNGNYAWGTPDTQSARMLNETGVKTYVVGFSAPGSADRTLRAIAVGGGTCEDPDQNNCYFDATSGTGLRLAISTILSDILGGVNSRTAPVTTTRTSFRDQKIGMYEVSASFEVKPGNSAWVGHLERVTYQCKDGVLTPERKSFDFAEKLKDRVKCGSGNDPCGRDRMILTSYLKDENHKEMISVFDSKAGQDFNFGSDNPFTPDCDDGDEADKALLKHTHQSPDYTYYEINPESDYLLYPSDCRTDLDCATGKVCQHGQCGYPKRQCKTTIKWCNNKNHRECVEWERVLTGRKCVKKKRKWWGWKCVKWKDIYEDVCKEWTCEDICYYGKIYHIGDQCTKHSDCSNGKVCHMGRCVTGDFLSCDSTNLMTKLPLADIYHSNPVIVKAPEMDLPLPGYRAFAAQTAHRDTMVYVGANDGMLHAFLLGAFESSPNDEGEELWAFVPKGVYPNLSKLRFGHGSYVDGTPMARDLLLNKESEDESGEWATVLAGGLREGGRGYYALDVTAPKNPKLLFDITNQSSGFSNLQLTYAQPELGTIQLEINGKVIHRGVAFLSSGIPSQNQAISHGSFYVVDLKTGAILREFTQLDNASHDLLPLMTGTPKAFNTFPGALVTRVFVGDGLGRLLRIDLTSPKPEDWKIEVFYDPRPKFNTQTTTKSVQPAPPALPEAEPIYFQPVLAKNENNQLIIIFGNGDVDHFTDWNSKNNFIASLKEVMAYDEKTGEIHAMAEENWFFKFTKQGERLTGEPIVYDSIAYFPTFVPGNAACDFGHARVYSTLFDRDDANGHLIPGVDLKIDGDPDKDLYADFGNSSVIFGLEIANRPSCMNRQEQPDGTITWTPPAEENQPQLVIQAGHDPLPPGTPQTSSAPKPEEEISTKVRIDLPKPVTTLRPTAWTPVNR